MYRYVCLVVLMGLVSADYVPCPNGPGPCANGGQCYVGGWHSWGSFCICTTGWRGENCTEIDYCQSHPCQNGGTCSCAEKPNPNLNYMCYCPPTYGGYNCEFSNPCSSCPPATTTSCETTGLTANGRYCYGSDGKPVS